MFLKKIIFQNEQRIFTLYKFLFLFIYCYVIVVIFDKIVTSSVLNWTMSDWLINYQDGGFKRRGLIGTILIVLSDYGVLSLKNLLFLVQSSFFTLFFYNIYRGLLIKKIDLFFVSLLFLPFALPFFVMYFDNFFLLKKEIILLFLASHMVLINNIRKLKIYLFSALVISVLIYEVNYFYIPFCLYYLVIKEKRIDYLFILTIISVTSLEMIAIYFFGHKINEGNSIELLKQRGIIFESPNYFLYQEKISEFQHIKLYFLSHLVMVAEFSTALFMTLFYVRKIWENWYLGVLVL